MRESSGWTVPAHYGDVAAEHAAVRHQVGIADLSHRGTLRVTGDDRVKWLQSVISNDILPLQPGHGRYSSFLTHKGKMLTYFRVYQQPDSVVIEDVGEIGDLTYQSLRKFLLYGTKAKLENCAETWGLLVVSGPQAAEVIRTVFGHDVMRLGILDFLTANIDQHQAMVMRTEETGEADFEYHAAGRCHRTGVGSPHESRTGSWDQALWNSNSGGPAHGSGPSAGGAGLE